MVEKNRDLLEKLAAETIKKIYNTYVDYMDRVDVFYVCLLYTSIPRSALFR